MVLLRERHHGTPKRCLDVLGHGVLFRWRHLRCQQGRRVWYLQRVEDALLDLAQVVELREHLRALRHRLHLGKALRLAEDVRV